MPLSKIFSRLRQVYHDERRVFWSMGGVILAILLFLLPTIEHWTNFETWYQTTPTTNEQETSTSTSASLERKFLPVYREISWQTLFRSSHDPNESEINQKILANTGLPTQNLTTLPAAVIIENHGTARYQQTGLREADVVYETLAEGGITRFLAIFLNQAPKRVGPVRSIRPYFVDWAEEYAGALVHAGGSETALAQLAQSNKLVNFDEDDLVFLRDTSFLKPHNLFANIQKVKTVLANKNWGKANPTLPFQIEEDATLPWDKTQPALKVNLNFSLPNYAVKYEYNALKKRYLRWHGEKKHVDVRRGGQIAPRNIIVQITQYYVMDDVGRLDLTTQGEGLAFIFSDGRLLTGKWGKSVSDAQTTFFDANDNQLILPPGQTWIEVINDPELVEWE